MANKNNNPYANLDLRNQIYMECASMAGYALAKGKSVPADAIKNIDAFQENGPTKAQNEMDITELVETHNFLARLIDPATPKTVLLLDREQESKTILKFLGPVSLVRQLMLATVISLLTFVGLIATPYINATTLAEDVLAADGLEQLTRLIFYVSAAGLGASFTALYTVNNYVSRGTYDPCHQSSYWIRFLLGIIAGILLALLISEDATQANGMISKGVIRPLFAILGGFSADLLHTVLCRMVETFKSLFEGSTQNILDAQAQEAKAKLASLEIERRMDLAQNLMQVQLKMGAEPDPEQIKQQLNAILQDLMQSK